MHPTLQYNYLKTAVTLLWQYCDTTVTLLCLCSPAGQQLHADASKAIELATQIKDSEESRTLLASAQSFLDALPGKYGDTNGRFPRTEALWARLQQQDATALVISFVFCFVLVVPNSISKDFV